MKTTHTLTIGQRIENADALTVVAFGSHSQGGGPDVQTVTVEVETVDAVVAQVAADLATAEALGGSLADLAMPTSSAE